MMKIPPRFVLFFEKLFCRARIVWKLFIVLRK